MPLKVGFDRIYDDIRRGLGKSIEDPIPVKLGTLDETTGAKLLRVPTTDSDAPNMFYFSELPTMQEFRGWAVNAGPTALQSKNLKYGTPIYIKRDVLNGVWVIHGLLPELGSEYIEGDDLNAPEPVQLSQLTAGLLDETDPPSMSARVLASWYDQDYVESQTTASQTASVPATNGKALYRLVQLDAETGTLSYASGAQFDALLTHAQAYAIDVAGSILPRPSAGTFRVGYIKLISGMTSIRRTANIWAVQEIITKGGNSTFSGARAQRSSDFNVENATDTIVDWNTESYDTDTYHDNSTNPSRLTIPTTGYYRVGWKLVLSSTTQWSSDLLINGSLNETIIPITTAGGHPVIWVTKSLTAGQYLQLQVWQASGGQQQVQSDSWFACEFVGA